MSVFSFQCSVFGFQLYCESGRRCKWRTPLSGLHASSLDGGSKDRGKLKARLASPGGAGPSVARANAALGGDSD